ncbi:zinc finger protein (eukaryotic) [Acanthamoeba polyphaga moumouvirus]|uniref:Zinc finger protein (Eukaryotic) n=2 Tax=Moumouvirus TaxID=3080801 RepID=L7RCG3_9VIRU|nr:zinc finger protein (eukaryotic) [Acanthamoeba polyphaga moumouvirus]AEX62368.1 hypothetical protein mv_L163 [Moumouvirus Monve]AGC02284.1 zinc finger protein (eukaryotic) [Acanthamoeba polyphaga moumouvirus]AQN68626.1 zinc finger protein [Saudi moumouvirus]
MHQFKSCTCGSCEYLSEIFFYSNQYQLIHKCSICQKIYSDKKIRTQVKSELAYIPARDVLKIPVDKIKNMYRITPGPNSIYYTTGPYYTDELARFYKSTIPVRKLHSGELCYKLCLGCGFDRFTNQVWNNLKKDPIDNNKNPTLCNLCMVKWYNHIGCSDKFICLYDVSVGDLLGINWLIKIFEGHKKLVYLFIIILILVYYLF